MMILDKESLTFSLSADEGPEESISLKMGYACVSEEFFKNDFPTEAETDYAINYIEDVLMSNKRLHENNGRLFSSDEILKSVFQKNGLEKELFSRREIENLFSQYAKVVMGAPRSYLGAGFCKKDYAAVLILREIMHHLDYEILKIC
ncbi:hypothetical protein [Marinilabilia salmonicolor]|jgi:hypothetical protein|uniref:Uncharacterized protein n=1 Tax=Marinilabilia salmonicolor TaxID=989 RepID=A0A2T0X694_9BACT|nr:hypothetical protein [Marinilabilia salmonicolor]PRY94405.1 hypothetical protein BY457_12058 [Marinilabilia salmonicolor]RCW29997.1 hypothetical protein DFO77_1248 [Marinilabilia salmonicolor]